MGQCQASSRAETFKQQQQQQQKIDQKLGLPGSNCGWNDLLCSNVVEQPLKLSCFCIKLDNQKVRKVAMLDI